MENWICQIVHGPTFAIGQVSCCGWAIQYCTLRLFCRNWSCWHFCIYVASVVNVRNETSLRVFYKCIIQGHLMRYSVGDWWVKEGMILEHWCNNTDRGNRSTRRKICPSVTLCITIPTRTGLGLRPDLRGERPATDRLSLGIYSTWGFSFLIWDILKIIRRPLL